MQVNGCSVVPQQSGLSLPPMAAVSPLQTVAPATSSTPDTGPDGAWLAAEVFAVAQRWAAGGTVPAAWVVTSRNTLREFLPNSDAIFARMRSLIANARSEVLLQTFAWQDGSAPALMLHAALRELHAAHRERRIQQPDLPPVVVRFMVRRHPFTWLVGRGTYQLERLIRKFDAGVLQVELVEHHEKLFGALHSKSVVVDGNVALLCGANIEHNNDPQRKWFDTGFVLSGDAAQGLRADAIDLWQGCRRRCTNVPGLPPPPDFFVGERREEVGMPMAILSRPGQGNPLYVDLGNPKDQAVLRAFELAQSRICILSPNLNLSEVVSALIAALQRRVQVDLLLSAGFNDRTENLYTTQGGTNRFVIKKILHALRRDPGARACLRARWFSCDGMQAVQGNRYGASHAKGACVDDRLLLLGSFNFDKQSSHSREVGVAIDSAAAARGWCESIFSPQFERAVPALGHHGA